MPNPLWKRFMQGGGRPPLYPNLSFYSKKRTGSTVVNEINGGGDGELVYNPLTDIIDINDTVKYPRGDVIIDSKGHPWDNVTLLTKLDDVIGNKTFKIVKNFDDFQAVNNGRSTTDYYIMSKDIDCSDSQTMNETTLDIDAEAEWVSGTYLSPNLVKVQVDGGAYTGADTLDYDVYIKTPYTTGYGNTVSPELDTEEKYWHIYNYEGFRINEFKGVFSGNGFELQNCYVNKASNNAGVFSSLNGGKLSNIGVTGSVIGYGGSVGGLVGYNLTSSIINSYSTGSVIGYGNYVGGLVGYNLTSSINNSYSTGSVIGYLQIVGGLVGYNRTSSIITNSYSTGSVIGYDIYVGGLVGVNSSSSITNSYYSSLSEQIDTGKGLLVPDADMKGIANIDTFVGWDFTNIWAIDDGYPYLRIEIDSLANPISNSKIVNNYDGYIQMPADIEIETGKPLFNRDDTDIYNEDATSTDLYLGDGMGGEDAYYWHISELNTATILSYMNNDYKNSWFVKNTFDGSEVKTIKEILAYNAPTTDAEDLAKIMKYLGIGE